MKSAVRFTAVCFLAGCAFAQNSIGIFTAEYDNGRTGQNRRERILTPASVTAQQFGKVFSYSVDGQIYAQPLWVHNVVIPGKGPYDVVYIETQMDTVYAFDAAGATSTPLWQASFIDLANGIGPVPCWIPGVGSCGVWPYSASPALR